MKHLFDTIRAIAGRGLTQAEVDSINAALDDAPAKTLRSTGPAGVALIKEFEGLRLKAYPDPGTGGEPWTIGIGTTIYPDGRKVRSGDVITEAQAEQYLRHDLAKFEAAVNQHCPVTTQPQFDALVSFAYNVGGEALRTSTLRRIHNEGKYGEAAEQFARWNRAAGKVLAGLTRRRAAEAKLYRSGS